MSPEANASEETKLAIEVPIVILVIILLAAAAVPTYRGRVDQAKISQAGDDIKRLAEAQTQVARDHGFYVPLQMLDNLGGGETRGRNADDITNESGSVQLIDPNSDFSSETPAPQPLLSSLEPRVAALREGWAGPYAWSKRVYLGPGIGSFEVGAMDLPLIRRDYPIDPWGNPYRFYSPAGMIGSRAAETEASALNSDEFSDGAITTQDDRFDSFAIVSFGPDGISDSISTTKDDRVYLFETEAESSES